MANSVASWSSVTAVSADPAAAASIPDAASMRYCRVAPAAAPAGTTRLSALAASCDVEIENQSRDRKASGSRSHTHAKLVASARTAAPSQSGVRVARRGHAQETAPRLGMEGYG